jgi:glycosyl transferase family 2
MTTPKVSVLMTAYNREALIAASIESVLAQTLADLELLIVDDCSRDGTLDVARRYERLDSRVHVVANERNLGDYGNRNHAATYARAPFLKYHDSDDLMYPHCLDVMVSMMMSEPRASFGLSKGSAWPGGPCPMLLTPRMAYQREYLGGGLFMCGPGGAIFRTEAFRRLGGFANVGVVSDQQFWIRACRTEHVLLLPADLFWYRLHPAQEMQSDAGRKQYAMAVGMIWEAIDAPDCPLNEAERRQARRNRAYHLAKRMLQDLRRGRWASAIERLRYSGMSPVDWLRYLRPASRDANAGTPRMTDGDFVAPSWATPRDRREKAARQA